MASNIEVSFCGVVKQSNVIFNTRPVSEGFSSILGFTLRSTKACFMSWNVTALSFATFDSVFVHKEEKAVGNVCKMPHGGSKSAINV